MKDIPLAVTEEGNKYFRRTLYSLPGISCPSNRNSFVLFF